MGDIKALELLANELIKLKAIPKPPTNYSESAKYKKNTEKVISQCSQTMIDVSQYAKRINENIDSLRAVIKDQTRNIQQEIKKTLDSIKYGTGTIPSNVIQYVRELQQTAKSMIRLEEFMLETENVFGKIQENVGVTMDDIDKLKGYIESWKLEKDENYEEEKRRLEAERLAREEAERKRREEDERRKGEEEERRRREEEERKKREEEEKERKRREAEERRLEEERRRKEEEERLKREEDERKRKEEDERKKREEEDKRKREEDERRKSERERQRLEAIRREKERKEKEEAAKKWRLDPNNWKNKIYKRSDDQVDSNKAYHKNVCCVISTPPSPEDKSSDNQPDLECLASDEVDDIIETLNDGEKIASSVINLKSKNGEVALEGSKLLGAEIDKFENAKLVLVARRKSQTIIVDKPGISQFSNYDKNIRIVVPRDAVTEPTELKLSIKPVTDEALSNISKENQDCDGISAVSSLIILTCQRPLNKDMEIDLIKTGQRSGTTRSYYVYRTLENAWKIAEIEYKGRNQDVSVTLPAGKYKYSLLQLDLPPSVPKDNSLSIGESIYEYLNKSVVRVIFRQKGSNPTVGIVNCVRRDQVDSKLAEMDELGYNFGPDVSREFSISEGQRIRISCSGNIDLNDTDKSNIIIPFFAYMDTAKENLIFEVKDRFKQRDMQDYMGNVVCAINEPNGNTLEIILPVILPKLERMKSRIKTTAVRFPYFLTSLASFLAWKLAEMGDGIWESVVGRLESKDGFQKLYRRAKARVEDDADEKALCRVVILDWMKTTERHRDKVIFLNSRPIERALEECGLVELKQECHEFVTYQKEKLSDAKIAELALKLSGDTKDIGQVLELEENVLKKIVEEHANDAFGQREACLQAWRSSDTCVRSGAKAVGRLMELFNI